MSMLQIFEWVLLAIEVWVALPILYLLLLSISAILRTRKREAELRTGSKVSFSRGREGYSFAILVPAHNEETVLLSLLESLAALTYPKHLYSVYVVADNCTDTTAELVRSTEWVHVYERFDQSKRGKGYALNWLLQKLEEEQLVHDAYIVLDADSVVAPGFLQAMARELACGVQALQANNTVLNTSASPSTALRWIALSLMNHVRPLGRNGLGASSTLTGNGMCLHRSVLQSYPWQAFSAGEDYQYYLTLIEHGVRVYYVPEAVARSQMPITFAQMRTQDIRWEAGGGSEATWRIVLRLLRAAFKSRDLARIEAVIELLIPPLSFMVGSCLLIGLAALVLWALPGISGLIGLVNLLGSFLLWAGLFCYIGTAFYLLRPPHMVYVSFFHAPRFMLWKLWVFVVLRKSKRHTSEWIRTSRTTS